MTEEERKKLQRSRLPLVYQPGATVNYLGNTYKVGQGETPTKLVKQGRANLRFTNPRYKIRTPEPQGVFDKFKDLFDANTDHDKYKRLLRGEPADYTEQQKLTRRDNVQSIETNPFRRAWQEVTEAPRRIGVGLARNTSQQDEVNKSLLREQEYMSNNILKAQRKLKDPGTSQEEKLRWFDYLQKSYPDMFYRDQEIKRELERFINDADPVAGIAALAEMGIDLATLGLGGKVASTVVKSGLKGAKYYEPVVSGALGGGIGAVTARGSDVTPLEIGVGAGAGGTFGAAFPLGGAATRRIYRRIKGIDKLTDELATSVDPNFIKTKLQQSVQDLEDSTATGISKVIAETSDPKLVREIVDGVAESTPVPKTKITEILEDPKKATKYVNDEFEEFTDVEKSDLIQRINQSNTPEEVEQALLEATQRRQQLSEQVADRVPPKAEGTPNEQLVEVAESTPPSAKVSTGKQVDEVSKDIKQAKLDDINERIDSSGFDLSEGKTNLRGLEAINPDAYIRKLTKGTGNLFNKAAKKGNQSENIINRNIVRAGQGVGRNIGKTATDQRAARMFRGESSLGKLLGRELADLGEDYNEGALAKVWATIDSKRAQEVGINVKLKDLDDSEMALRQTIVEVRDKVTDGNLQRGLINEEQAADPNYLLRDYLGIEESNLTKEYKDGRSALLAQYGHRKQQSDLLDQTVTDPTYLMGVKTAKSYQAWAIHDYAKYLKDSGITSPKRLEGYEQLPTSKLYGDAAGEWVPKSIFEDFNGFKYNNEILETWNAFASKYDRWTPRQYKKKILTVFNPAVRMGNQASNRFIFSTLNGLSPIKFNKVMHTVKQMSVGKAKKSKYYYEAIEEGLSGTDITKADFVKKISDNVEDPNILKQAENWFEKSYSRADDNARISAYIMRRDQGYSKAEAARLTQRGFQDYASVGFFYDLAAKTPVFGNAFVRFAGDYVRILKNQIVDNPMKLAASLAVVGGLAELLSNVSGESEEDRKTREERFGAPSIPFTSPINRWLYGEDRNISLAFQTPWGEVNVARFIPGYALNEVSNGLTRLLPFSEMPIEKKEDGSYGINPSSFNDPLLGQFAQLGIDQDFRGKSIADPENYGQFRDDLPASERLRNRARFLFTNNAPLGREADTVLASYNKQLGPVGSTDGRDVYGSERTPGQAWLRAGGLKVQQYGPEQAQEQRGRDDYFEEKNRIDALARELPQEDQEAFRRLSGYYKKREKTENEFKPGTQRYVRDDIYNFPEDKWGEYVNRPELYDMVKHKKQSDSQRLGAPLQPEFDERLSLSFRKQLISNKSLAPGEDVEADERLYSHPEYDYYRELKDEFDEAADKYYPNSDDENFKDEMVKHESADFPKKGSAYQAYSDAYGLYDDGLGPKPEWSDQIGAERDAYNDAKWEWTNKERIARGLPEIPKEVWDNVTFGFTEDEEKVYNKLKYDKGYGKSSYYKYGKNYYEFNPRTGITQLLGKGGQKKLPKMPEVNVVPNTPKLQYKKPFKGSKPKARFRFK